MKKEEGRFSLINSARFISIAIIQSAGVRRVHYT